MSSLFGAHKLQQIKGLLTSEILTYKYSNFLQSALKLINFCYSEDSVTQKRFLDLLCLSLGAPKPHNHYKQ